MKLTKTFMVKTMLDANFPDALIGYDSGLFAKYLKTKNPQDLEAAKNCVFNQLVWHTGGTHVVEHLWLAFNGEIATEWKSIEEYEEFLKEWEEDTKHPFFW